VTALHFAARGKCRTKDHGGGEAEAVVRLGRALGGIVLVSVAGGCTSDDPEKPAWTAPSGAPSTVASAPPWNEPASYAFVLTRGCDDAAPLGRYRATVRDGAVVEAERIDAPVTAPSSSAEVDLGPVAPGSDGEEIEVPSLSQLLEMAQTASEDGGEVTTVADGADGHPVKVVINVSEAGPGGAECWSISDYKPAA
jgi:hypothetical protein